MNYIKCRYCGYKLKKIPGKDRVDQLARHVVSKHQRELEKSLHIDDITKYVEDLYDNEDRFLGEFRQDTYDQDERDRKAIDTYFYNS